jgi:hypothetical protein
MASGTVEPCRAFQVPSLSLGELVEIEDREIEPDKGPKRTVSAGWLTRKQRIAVMKPSGLVIRLH